MLWLRLASIIAIPASRSVLPLVFASRWHQQFRQNPSNQEIILMTSSGKLGYTTQHKQIQQVGYKRPPIMSLAFALRFPVRVSARSIPSPSKSTGKQPSADDLRKLYRITNPADVGLARARAKFAVSTLATYLQNRPIAKHNLEAYESFRAWRERPGARTNFAIDAGCGTGHSTVAIARELDDVDVVGVDKSVVRLSRNATFRGDPTRKIDNALFLRADLVDFWRFCLSDSYLPDYHFLLYPNPYPKPCDMKRRWHGHPVLPVIAALGGRLELRASWSGYLHEFRAAYEVAKMNASCEPLIGNVEKLDLREGHDTPLTNFEAKYMRVEHAVHRLVIDARDPEERGSGDKFGGIRYR